MSELPGHGGTWRFDIKQEYQVLDVDAQAAARPMVVRGAKLRGEEIRIAVTGLVGGRPWNQLFRGRLVDGRIGGEVRVSDGENEQILPWKASRQP